MTPALARKRRDDVRERPILFSGPMVKAILAGTKTQTRRLVKPQPERVLEHVEDMGAIYVPSGEPVVCTIPNGWQWKSLYTSDGLGTFADSMRWHCPYGKAGDRLWVREAWATSANAIAAEACGSPMGSSFEGPEFVYCADAPHRSDEWEAWRLRFARWRPSIHMPRLASRLTLEVTDVRVQRLQDITEEDARAEGVDGHAPIPGLVNGEPGTIHCFGPDAARKAFALLWDGINGKRAPWASNPWVWAVSFRRV